MKHWEDAVLARLLLERGIVSRRILDGIPEDREEPLSLYLVRTGKLTEAQARRLRGEAMQLPLVCLECERESILLRCVAGEGLACPSCAGAVLFRPAPVRALLEKRRLLLHGSLAAALAQVPQLAP